ncbi:MAG TPA: MopE-related protein, partial [Myxococcota bacterium]|nr:MopE-related protein [Myxococcota bacterium]
GSSSLCTCAEPAGYPAMDNLDCDDTEVAVNPDRAEDCATAGDDNCDGDTNDLNADGCTEFYLDADGDGYGSPTSQCTCVATGSYSAGGMEDCDDAAAGVHPGATESCATSADDDCDGDANEVNAVACTNYYPDADGDGFGDGTATCTCTGGSGSSAVNTDCDDSAATVYPGATETCRNGIDDNCDGSINSCEPSDTALATGTILYTGERVDDAAGTVAVVGDVNGDGYDDMFVGAPYNDDGGQDMGTSYLIKGSANPRSGSLGSAVQFMNTYAAGGLYSGLAVAAAGDFNQDGYDDMLMGGDDQYTFLIRGSASPTSGYTTTALRWAASDNSSQLGDALSGGGDVNGDGYPDFLVGGWAGDTSSPNAGSVYVIPGSSSTASSNNLSSYTVYSGENQNDYLGYSVANAWDVDADGYDDMLLGAPGNADGASSGGAAYLMFGGSSLSSSTVAGQVQYWGTTYRDQAAYVAGPGDINGDGYADMLIGAPGGDAGATDGGTVFLIYGSASPSSHALTSYDGRIVGDTANLAIGSSLAAAGDVNSDGFPDVIVGANYSNTGGAYLVLGRTNLGTLTTSNADARYTGEQSGDVAGAYVGGGGDVDADGYDDLLIGAPGNDDAGSSAGTVYLVRGIGL